MAQITIKVSDLTHEPIEEDTLAARLIVEHHPNFSEPITLDVLPEEVESALAQQEEQYVVLTYEPQGQEPRQVVMLLEEFNTLSTVSAMNQVLEAALRNQQEEQKRSRRKGGRRGDRREPRERIDYTSPEHAGEPHRGRITEAEKAYVRDHLQDVNKRLRSQGMREIDPNDPEMVERYGLTPPEPVEG
jgi:hypothetical protein